jgi:hypothetical protein
VTVIIEERLAAVKDVPLGVGNHSAPPAGETPCGFCAAEKWSWIRGLDWSDHPGDGTSRVLWAFVRTFQDNTDQTTRDAIDLWMVENADKIAATANDEHEQTRGLLAADWAARVALPLWLDQAGATDAANTLRNRPVADTHAAARELRDAINQIRADVKLPNWREVRAELKRRVREAVRKALDEGKGTAGAAAWAAEAAAWAAEAAAGAAEAAWAAGAAAWAAEAAAGAAEAAEAAEFGRLMRAKFLEIWGQKFKATTTEIRSSAIELLDRMVSVGAEENGA